ncbi:MAG: hypothetical protein CMO61_00960 [Verrucomicrobiales bacterium]|nr:hypothetical protein [Verrucomicrobiales bacterium]
MASSKQAQKTFRASWKRNSILKEEIPWLISESMSARPYRRELAWRSLIWLYEGVGNRKEIGGFSSTMAMEPGERLAELEKLASEMNTFRLVRRLEKAAVPHKKP